MDVGVIYIFLSHSIVMSLRIKWRKKVRRRKFLTNQVITWLHVLDVWNCGTIPSPGVKITYLHWEYKAPY